MQVWLNGQFVQRDAALVSAFDAGIQHGVGLFETCIARNGTVFRAEAHARRLVESGVRFVQLFDWGWDHHGSSQPEDMHTHLPIKARQTERPIAALLADLKQRGLLDETLVIWGGEFGRTPMRENRGGRYGKFVGRDHHPFAFTMWMAGGGIKGGLNFGSTDDVGYYPAENPMSVRDLQATVLHLLGLDPYKLSMLHQGLNARLIGPTDEGKIRKEILA